MKKCEYIPLKNLNVVLSCMMPFFMLYCAPSMKQLEKQTILPEIDVVQVKEFSEEALKLAQESKTDVQILSSKVIDLDSRVLVLDDKVSEVSLAKIEELENRISLLVEAFKDLHEKLAAIELLPQITIAPKKRARTQPPVFSTTSPTQILTSSEYDQYQLGMRSFDKKMYSESIRIFLELREKFPDGDYLDRAQYWIGECYYAQAEYAKAVVEFSKVLEYKNSSKADDAQLKLGLSYLRMGKQDLAANEFRTVIQRFPASEFVPRAKKYLAEFNVEE